MDGNLPPSGLDAETQIPKRSDELADAAFKSVFPHGLPPAKPVAGSAIVRSFPLTSTHLEALKTHHELGESLGLMPEPRKRMSRRHHRVAQLLASGMEPGRVSVLTNMGQATISILQTDPLFCELLEYYASQVDDEFRTVVEEMAELHTEVVEEIRGRLEDNPNSFTISQLTELMKAVSDRTGNGPTSTSKSLNITAPLDANTLALIKSSHRPAPRPADGVHGSDGIRASEGAGNSISLPVLPTVVNAPTYTPGGEWEGAGDGVGAEGPGPRDEVVAVDSLAVPRLD